MDLEGRKEHLFLAAGMLMFFAAIALLVTAMSLQDDLDTLEKNQIRGRNERIDFQNDNRQLQCRLLGAHDRNDPLCAAPPSTTIPLD